MASTTGASRGNSKPNGFMVQLTPAKAANGNGNITGTGGLRRTDTMDSQLFTDASETPAEQDQDAIERQRLRQRLERSAPSVISSVLSVPPPGSILTGKQEHYLKRELLATQTAWEVAELSSPTALQRFGAPFRSDAGEVAPEDSELPLLRYIFVHHVRNFPFLNQAKEKEFWQDKLQSFLESFANKHVSSAEDRLEQTKRAKLAIKATKLVELMMVSGIPTASGYEERIRFSEMEVVDRGANEEGLVVNKPDGHEINGWDVNVAGVRVVSEKRHVRHHQHAEFLLRVKRKDEPEMYVARRFGQFAKMHKRLRVELPGKVLPPLPRKNMTHSIYSGKEEMSDDESVDSFSTQGASTTPTDSVAPESNSAEAPHVLPREDQRVSLRAFLRHFLANETIASSASMIDFLTHKPITLTHDEVADVEKRKAMDERRMEEQQRFFEIARERARELDVHMEKFRRKVIERNGLRDLFSEIKRKEHIADLDPEYKKFAEWLRIEVAATLYHLFLAEDNSPELFAQAKRIHGLVPYGALKQVIRFTNPAAVMSAVLDLFMAQPLGAKSLLQRIFGFALGDGIKSLQKSIDSLTPKIADEVLCRKIKAYTDADEAIKRSIRAEAVADKLDLLVKILQSPALAPELTDHQTGLIYNAYVAWDHAIENTTADTPELHAGAELYAHLKQLLRLHTRLRDKQMMLALVDESTTLRLVTDLARFADDAIAVIEKAQRQDGSADPNQTVQAFIDLCERHEGDLYKFVHEVHLHDNGLFDKLMTWIEGILDFLRNGPRSREGEPKKLDMNALFAGALEMGIVDGEKAVREINGLIRWQMARKRWHQDKTRLKMASGPAGPAGGGGGDGSGGATAQLAATFQPGDFGLDAMDLQDLAIGDEDEEDEGESSEEDEVEAGGDPMEAERKRRKRNQDALKRSAGEPVKPRVVELPKMMEGFLGMLRGVLAE
ncbi:hypothetical protein LTR32_002196 [Rachicladosporium monterosium]|uniref:PX domain-containing protein n=1 Tax=Rachicladosporium monterosium TaxID=1507873 RepID=A0ABR0LB25_9PEZI|nr:hypothetical protein LTR32_002196 [Rachicladosporium monterosium]